MYIVVENAGYEGERDICWCGSWRNALRRMKQIYTQDELDEMHVAICREQDGERSYEV